MNLPVLGHLTSDALGQSLPESVRWSVPAAGPPAGTPVIAGSVLVLPLSTGSVAAHRTSDGAPIWNVALAAEQPLAGDEGHVYVAAAGTIHALDARTGKAAWRAAAGAKITAPPLAHAGWVIAATAGELLGLRGSDGTVLWRAPLAAAGFRPALDGDLLVVSLVDGRVAALDVTTGTLRWERQLGGEPGEPLAIGGRVYVGTANKFFYSLYAGSGRVEYRRAIGGVTRGRAAVDDQHVYFTAMDHVLRAVDRGDGALRWKQGLNYRPAAGPVLLDAAVLVPGNVDGPLPAFVAATGAPAGKIAFPGLLTTVPLFAALADGTAVAVGITGGLENKWVVSMLAPLPYPSMSVQPLTALPGAVLPLPIPLS